MGCETVQKRPGLQVALYFFIMQKAFLEALQLVGLPLAGDFSSSLSIYSLLIILIATSLYLGECSFARDRKPLEVPFSAFLGLGGSFWACGKMVSVY